MEENGFTEDIDSPSLWATDSAAKEEEMDKPSFLRRLTRKNKKSTSLSDIDDTKEL